MARVIRRYRSIDAAEQALIELAIRRHIDGLIALELRRLEQRYAPERARIQRLPTIEQRRAETSIMEARYQADVAAIRARLQTGFLAIPVKVESNQTVVSLGQWKEGELVTVPELYELSAQRGESLGSVIAVDSLPGDPSLRALRGTQTKATVIEVNLRPSLPKR
jgi:hypothetical protein